jgi:hypothetical protein
LEQVWPPVHAPQAGIRPPPQRSVVENVPHSAEAAAQSSASVSGVQPHWLFVHTFGAVQVPQFTVRLSPQRSVIETEPHSAVPQISASVSARQLH